MKPYNSLTPVKLSLIFQTCVVFGEITSHGIWAYFKPYILWNFKGVASMKELLWTESFLICVNQRVLSPHFWVQIPSLITLNIEIPRPTRVRLWITRPWRVFLRLGVRIALLSFKTQTFGICLLNVLKYPLFSRPIPSPGPRVSMLGVPDERLWQTMVQINPPPCWGFYHPFTAGRAPY